MITYNFIRVTVFKVMEKCNWRYPIDVVRREACENAGVDLNDYLNWCFNTKVMCNHDYDIAISCVNCNKLVKTLNPPLTMY